MKIIAIGGGTIKKVVENKQIIYGTLSIDKEILKFSDKKNPKILFIPTASMDDESYIKVFEEYFGKKLKCEVEILKLYKSNITIKEIKNKILNTNIIYVGGGNTLMMMNLWKKLGILPILKEVIKKDIVLCGTSAGGICWFKYGNSDSRKFKNSNAKLIKVSGLDLFPLLFCPHYSKEKDRKQSLKNMTKNMKEVAIAVDDYCAIQIQDEKFRIISSKIDANAYKVYWKNGVFYHKKIEKNKKFMPIDALSKKI